MLLNSEVTAPTHADVGKYKKWSLLAGSSLTLMNTKWIFKYLEESYASSWSSDPAESQNKEDYNIPTEFSHCM